MKLHLFELAMALVVVAAIYLLIRDYLTA